MFSMLFIAAVILVLKQDTKNLSYFQSVALCLSSLSLLLMDYSGAIYFVAGLFFLLIQSIRLRSYKILIPIFISLLIYLVFVFAFLDLLQGIQVILNWSKPPSRNIGSSTQDIGSSTQGLIGFIQFFYVSLRPGLDLINTRGLSLPIAIGLPIILLGLYVHSLVSTFIQNRRNLLVQLVLFSSIIWLFVSPTGYALTRLFLPSHFFMIAIIIHYIESIHKSGKFIYWFIISLMIVACLKDLVSPTLPLYSMIPYQQIAKESLGLALQEKVRVIALSDNSLNTLSIERYLKQEIEDKHIDSIQVIQVGEQRLVEINENTKSSLIFISHMKEREFVDVRMIEKKSKRSLQMIKGYIELQNLPYNSLWKNKVLKSAQQPYAVQSYLLNQKDI
jgi:hypothetical protein